MKHLVFFTSVFAAATLFAGVTVHVAPNGCDCADGSEKSPFATIERARDQVRALRKAGEKGEIKVVFADGVYKISKTISFGKNDSAPDGSRTVYLAKNPGKVHFDAGKDLPALSPLGKNDPAYGRISKDVRDKIMVADLKKAGIDDYGVLYAEGVGDNGANGMELVWNGKLQTLARWPNDGYTGIGSVAEKVVVNGKKMPQDRFVYEGDRPSKWIGESDPYANGFFCHNWAAARIGIKSIDPATKTIVQKGKGSPYGYSKIGFWFGYNLLCELDSPGEYYLDRNLGRLYFYPPAGACAESPRLTFARNIVSVSNSSNIAFDGIVFENCRGLAIEAKDSKNVSIKRCALKNIGAMAIKFVNVKNSAIAGCDISYCNAGGIAVFSGDKMKLEHANVEIRNCHIHHFALVSLTYCGAVRIDGCGLKVSHNTIHDGPHGAVFFGGKENDISYNEIHSVCLDSGEMGAVYTGRDWTLCGNTIVANYFHDIYNPRSQRNRAIMLDDGCAGITMTSNVFVRIAEGISLSGIGNAIENNIFIENHPAISCWQKWENREDYTNTRYTHAQLLDILAKHDVRNEPWKSKYPYLGMIDDAIKTGKLRDPATRTRIKNNIVYKAPDDWCKFMTKRFAYSPQTWDVGDNFIVNESIFKDPDKGDYSIDEKSSVFAKGFKPVPPVSKMGVYESEERFSWPVSSPVTIKCGSLTYKGKGK